MLRIGRSIILIVTFIGSVVWGIERQGSLYSGAETIAEAEVCKNRCCDGADLHCEDEESDHDEDDEDHHPSKQYTFVFNMNSADRLFGRFKPPSDADLERLVPPPKHS
jgi:hypothetical protein